MKAWHQTANESAAELAADRERREAAESLLRVVVTVWPHLTPITDHFARYKD